MKMRINVLKMMSLLLLAVLCSSCVLRAKNLSTERGDGNVNSYRLKLGDYEKLQVAGGMVVYYFPGLTFLEIETDSNLLSKIKVEEKNGQLAVYSENIAPTKLIVKTGSPSLSSMQVSGHCDVVLAQELTAPQFEVSLTGASHLRFLKDMVVDKLTISSTGASEVDLSGRVGKGVISLTGASDLNAYNCQFGSLECKVSGSSDVNLGLVDELSYDLTGASQITYHQQTKVLKANSSGASSVSVKK